MTAAARRSRVRSAATAVLLAAGAWVALCFLPSDSAATAPLAGGPCVVTHTRAVSHVSMPIGADLLVTSTLHLDCAVTRAPLHVVVLVDASEQMVDRGRNLLAPLLSELEAAIDAVDLDEHPRTRIGVVSFRDRIATTVVPLTSSRSQIASGLHNIWVRNGLECPQCGLREGLRKARRMLQAGRDGDGAGPPREVILVASRGFEPTACDAVRAAASEVKPFGILMATACGGGGCDRRCLAEAASTLEHAFSGHDWTHLGAVMADMAGPAGSFHPVTAVEVRDRLGELVQYADGGEPDAVDGNELRWTFRPWSGAAVTRVLRARAIAIGDGPLAADGAGTIRYGALAGGVVSGTFSLDNVTIRVHPVTPTPTPTTAPTSTPLATPTHLAPATPPNGPTPTATAEPGPTAAPRARTVYAPFAAAGACGGDDRPMDLVLLVDVSGSMAAADVPTFQNRWAAAGAIGQDVVRYHVLARDRVAVLPFAESVEVRARLGDDRATVLAALAALPQWNGSRVDVALEAALAETRRGFLDRPDARAVIVLVTDGDLNQTEASELERRARTVRAAGVRLFAIGLGRDVDAAALARLTGSRGRVFVTDETHPMAMAEALGSALRCPR